MSRVPGTFKQSRWALVENPAYAGRTPSPQRAVCHDRSPFLTITCDCGFALHQHESSIAHAPTDAEIASRCLSCGKTLVFPPGYFQAAFQKMRDDGWIDDSPIEREDA